LRHPLLNRPRRISWQSRRETGRAEHPKAIVRPVIFPSARELRATAPRLYLFRQPFVLPGHFEETISRFGNSFVFCLLAKLSRLFAVVEHAFQLGLAGARRSKIVCHQPL